MALGNVMQANGSQVRAESEANLLKMEEMKRTRAGNTITGARMKEMDARAQEANSSSRKAMDAFYQARSAEDAKKAAVAGLISAIAGAGSGIAGAAGSSNANGFTIFSAALKGAFSIAGAIVALIGASEEAKLAQAQANTLSDEAKADQANVRALDGNPTG